MTADPPSGPRLSLRDQKEAILAAAADVFADRTVLVGSLLEARTQGLLDALDGGPAVVRSQEAAVQFEAALLHFTTTLAQHVDENRGLLGVLWQEEAALGLDADAANRPRSLIAEILARAEGLVARGLKARAFRRADPAVHGALLVGMVRGLALGALTGRGVDPSAGATEIVRVFLRGITR